MKIGVVYAGPQQLQLNCNLDDGGTVADAIERSGILRFCPDIDLNVQKVGVYGKFVKLDSVLKDGDRVEIYRKITRVVDDEDDDDD
ncbi:MAG TPA: RnfH family protein [Candidatus Kapabacteria bacterium]|nr:RnfH family protein [Candidatus Kapabacteria bacterium]